MFDSIKKFFSDKSGYVIAAFGVLLLLFGYERKAKQDAEANLVLADADKKDAGLEQKQADIEERIKQEKKDSKDKQDHVPSEEEIKRTIDNL